MQTNMTVIVCIGHLLFRVTFPSSSCCCWLADVFISSPIFANHCWNWDRVINNDMRYAVAATRLLVLVVCSVAIKALTRAFGRVFHPLHWLNPFPAQGFVLINTYREFRVGLNPNRQGTIQSTLRSNSGLFWLFWSMDSSVLLPDITVYVHSSWAVNPKLSSAHDDDHRPSICREFKILVQIGGGGKLRGRVNGQIYVSLNMWIVEIIWSSFVGAVDIIMDYPLYNLLTIKEDHPDPRSSRESIVFVC